MNRAMLLPNPLKDTDFGITNRVIETLSREGFDILLNSDFLGMPHLISTQKVCFFSERQAMEECDFVIVIGGDGSILHAAATVAEFCKPILGINAGTLGFMSELEPSELALIKRVKANDFTLDSRTMIDIFSINSTGKETFCASALNDAVIGKGFSAKSVRLSVAVDGEHTLEFSGDGLIVSTPTGSTAYSLAAGGPVLAPQSPCISVIPICPHSLSAKSLVVDDGSEIIIRPSKDTDKLYLSPDGRDYQILAPGEMIKIRKSRKTIALIRIKGIGFYERIRIKLAK